MAVEFGQPSFARCHPISPLRHISEKPSSRRFRIIRIARTKLNARIRFQYGIVCDRPLLAIISGSQQIDLTSMPNMRMPITGRSAVALALLLPGCRLP